MSTRYDRLPLSIRLRKGNDCDSGVGITHVIPCTSVDSTNRSFHYKECPLFIPVREATEG